MVNYNNVLCISGRELIRRGNNPNGIMPSGTYDSLVNRKKLEVLRPGKGEGSPALIKFSSLPEKYQKIAIERFGDPETEAQKKGIMEYMKPDQEAVAFFNKYRVVYSDNVKDLSDETKEEYVNNAIVLNALKKAWDAHVLASRGKHKRPLSSKFWKNAIKALANIQNDHPHTIKHKNWRRLQDKVSQYCKEGYSCLISGKIANENTVKITEESGEWLVTRFMSMFEIVTVEQLHAEYNVKADQEGWKKLKTPKSVSDYLNRPEVKPIWYAARYGELAAKEMFSRQNRRIPTSRRDARWYSDGTKLNYYYQDANGNVKTCQVYEVMDSYSECFLGYHISKSEDYEAQYHAFKMAIKRSGYKPYELKYDNQGGHKKLENSGLLKNLSNHAINTAPYNGKSKTIESAFGRFQSQYLHKDWFFTGQNITASKKESRANMERILANLKNLPTLEEVKARYAQRREEWNNAPHPKTGISRAEMYRTSVNDKVQVVDDLDIITIFGMMTQKPSTYRASGIEIEVKRVKHEYEVLTANGEPDRDFNRRNISRKFYVRYCPDDMDIVSLYEKDATGMRFIAMAQPYLKVNEALQDQTSTDHSRIRTNDILNKLERIQSEKERNALLEKYNLHPNQHGLNVAPLKGISKKDRKIDIGELQKEVSNMDMIAEQKKAAAKAIKKVEKAEQKQQDDDFDAFYEQRMELLQQSLN